MAALRQVAHFLLNLIGLPFWFILYLCLFLLTKIAILGDIIKPNSLYGNCWTYALAKWKFQHGKPDLLITIRRVGALRIPHASLLHTGGTIEETEPVLRHTRLIDAWLGLKILYFKYYVKK